MAAKKLETKKNECKPDLSKTNTVEFKKNTLYKLPVKGHKDYEIIGFMLVNPKVLSPDKDYQRPIGAGRKGNIYRSIRDCGFWHFFPMIVDEKFSIIDGLHRYGAALQDGVDLVMVCIIRFINVKKEIEYFTRFDSFDTGLASKDKMHALYLGGIHSTPQVVYHLAQSSTSTLYDRIAIQGKGNHRRYTINIILRVINHAVFGTAQHYERGRKANLLETRLTELIDSKKKRAVGMKSIESKVNRCINFIEDTFGCWTGKNKPVHLKMTPLDALLRFYIEADKIDAFSENRLEETIDKMRSFDRTHFYQYTGFPNASQNIYQALVMHYNTGRTANKIIFKASIELA